MAVISITPALVKGKPDMTARPDEMIHRLIHDHPAHDLVLQLVQHYPRFISRRFLMDALQMPREEPRHYACFEWLVMRANDTLPLTGWQISDVGERYRLTAISQVHHQRLVEEFNDRR